MQNKWKNGAIPALLIHCSIGTVYCWSIFSQEIADYIGFSKSEIEWAFSLAIFFLGMSAAFLGRLVEKDIKKASVISTLSFTLGLLGTSFFVYYGGLHPHSYVSLIGIYVCYGFIMGIGLGTGYLSPVKTLMIWFEDRKGLATGLAVAGFGAAKAIFSPVIQFLMDRVDVYNALIVLSTIFVFAMSIGTALLEKPKNWVEPQKVTKQDNFVASLRSRPISTYIGIWVMFYLNISCGLAIISQEKMIVNCLGLGKWVALIAAISAIFNAGGRIVTSAIADKLKDRKSIYIAIFAVSNIACVASTLCLCGEINFVSYIVIVLAIFLINAGYGGGFSNIPTLLHDYYGMKNVSTLHGITLSAWAFAGLTGNQLATFIVNNSSSALEGYGGVFSITCALYAVGGIACIMLVQKKGISKQTLEGRKNV